MAENLRTCLSCGTTNEEDARFCEGCGGSLARVCATCGLEAKATARFCRGCGAPLEDRAPEAFDLPVAGPARKTVTVMFADLAGSTTFEERVDAETAREVIGNYHELLRSTAQRHRAGVTKYIGDGFMAVWGVPEIGPDDAANAVAAAVELQERFVDLAAHVATAHRTELALRVAVNTGEVVVGAGDADLVGDALNVGARLEAECPRGRVVVGEETWRSTRSRYGYESLGQVQVKGRSAPVAVYQWLGRQSDAADAAPFVGRSQEVRRLRAVLADAIATRAARLVTVVGDPGVGKSRLATEFIGAQTNTSVIQARCAVEGTVALAPIVEMLRARDLEIDVPAGVSERDRLLRDLHGLATGVPGSVEENFWALRRFVEVLAWNGPVVFVLDDVQWADSLLLDFIEHLVEWIKEVPVLVLALARPELREIRPDLVTASRWVADTIHLSGLDAGATAELAAKVLGATNLPPELLRRLPSSTGGNPLFVREFVGMLAHDGVLVEHPNGWRLTIDVDAITIPPTIHALLASRLERLDTSDRRILEIASVVGSDFSVGMVRALAGGHANAIKSSLNRLRRLELAQPAGTYVGDEAVWRFHHVLIRDVAYRRLLKSDRAELHERLADSIEAGGPSVAFEADEMIARHLEAAHTYRRELGMPDEHTNGLASRAARHYSASARRALERDELVSAGTQAARGAALAAADESVRAELLLTGCEALLSAGDVTAGADLVDGLERIAGEALAPWATCYRCQFGVYTDPERLLEYDALLQGAIDEFARRADPAGLAKAHRVRASARLRLGRVGDGEVDLFEALIAARQSGDHRQITAALGAAPGAALWGPSPVPKAGGRCLDVVRMQRMTTAAPSLEATSLRHLAVLELLRGRPDKAREMLGEARQIVADLGLRHGLMETELFAGIIESMSGDPVTAEPHFRTALEGLDALGVGADAGQAAALLARSVLAQGRIDEADRYAAESERLAGHNLKTAIAWRAVRAEILSAQGRHNEATMMARNAVAVASGTDIVLDHAEACLALSRVLMAAGNVNGARAARDDARALYAAKEVSISVGPIDEPAVARREQPARAAFDGAQLHARAITSRLEVTNESCRYLPAFIRATEEHDAEGALAWFSDRFVYDDRRRLSGDPVVGLDAMRTAMQRVSEQYTQFEFRVLAVRGRRLHLLWSRWTDEDGNIATTLYVNESDEAGRIIHHIRFDEEDFESAYQELERRYYAGEGAAFAESGRLGTEYVLAINRGDFDRAFNELSSADLRFENRSRTAFPDPAISDAGTSFDNLNAMVASTRTWPSVAIWQSPHCLVTRFEREAIGSDNEQYSWTWLAVGEVRDGHFVSGCMFDVEDEDAAFAYAEERVRAAKSRLAVTNQACRLLPRFVDALRSHDVDAVVSAYADEFTYDDRRRLSGGPIAGREAMRAAVARICDQYAQFDFRVLAVRGDRLFMAQSRWSDKADNVTQYLHVTEVDDAGRVLYDGRFDEDDFDGAYRELEHRYYAGEGAAFTEAGSVTTEWISALNHRDYDRLIGRLTASSYRLENRSSSAFGHRTATEIRSSFEDLDTEVSWARSWEAAVCWLSPTAAIFRFQREAVGRDGEPYSWTWLDVCDIREGRIASACRFDLDDEDAAFAYAEERVRATNRRLAVVNRASETSEVAWRALQAGDLDAAVAGYSDRFVYDDRRRVSGNPIEGLAELRTASIRILEQYPHSEWRTLAVRGDRLELRWSRWWDDAGNQTGGLHVHEIDDDGRTVYHGRFDEDDFEGAYRELERRYYAGEGAAFAEAGAVSAEYSTALDRGEFDRVFGELFAADMRVENMSSSPFPSRSLEDLRASYEDLHSRVLSSRTWFSVVRWLSPTWAVVRFEREAIGQDNETYSWTWLHVTEWRAGRVSLICRFDLDDEDAAFAYAEERARASSSRLAVVNRASEVANASWRAMQAHNIDAAIAPLSDRVVVDDRRQLSGDPLVGIAQLHEGLGRVLEQYPHSELTTLAVRGERLDLRRIRMWDDSGNESTTLNVLEIDETGRIAHFVRFDEDDFEGALGELERRYYVGEGAAFAEGGSVSVAVFAALNHGEYDQVVGELIAPDIRIENRSRSAFPDRSADDLRSGWGLLDAMVTSSRIWPSAVCWVSPHWCVSRLDREAIGHDGELYTWTFLIVAEARDSRTTALCQFDIDDEENAFAYAEERVRADSSRLAVSNRAADVIEVGWRAMRNRDVDSLVATYADTFVYVDRRRLSGDPIVGRGEIRAAIERVLDQYNRFDVRVLAVRADRLVMTRSRWSDGAGNETTQIHVSEIDGDGLCIYDYRFDGDDFEGAYRELERRYSVGDGAAFADAVVVLTDYACAENRGDFERLFGELTTADFRVENRSRSVFGDRSVAEFRSSREELQSMVKSVRSWHSVMCWLSPTVVVGRLEREALGRDGEVYVWSFITVAGVDSGRLAWTCIFEIDDEQAAFDYAQERVQATISRLTVHNRACDVGAKVLRDFEIEDIDAVVAAFSDHFVYDDHRRLSGDPVTTRAELNRAGTRLRQHYNHFAGRTLAVRGERLQLAYTRWSDDADNETAHLVVIELADDGRIAFQATYDENDFMSAYRELDTRYFAGEGALFAEAGAVTIEYAAALNNRDLDRLFDELSVDGLRIENRSRSAFPDRSATELRSTIEDLSEIVESVREWHSASWWLSPNVCVGRHEREAAGHDGEHYSWTRLMAFEVRDGRMASICVFEPDDEQAAFAYAEELVAENTTRLPVTNRATQTFLAGRRAANARDVDAMVRAYAEQFEYDDRRKLAGNPLSDVRSGAERILAQYDHFEGRTLAVRGDRLHLAWSRWWTDAGYETIHLILQEVDDSGHITYEGRFDEDDFRSAYRELTRRYCARDAADISHSVTIATEWVSALNAGDFDRAFGELTSPDFRIENRSSTAFPDRSATELRAGLEDLRSMMTSIRQWDVAERWLSSNCVVARNERQAVGKDGEQYTWSSIDVCEIRDGRAALVCRFDVDDEQAAFAYADELVRAQTSRLAVTNRAAKTFDAQWEALQARDIDAAHALFSQSLVYDDHRSIGGNPLGDTRAALERILKDYTSFEGRTLAVRGESLHLGCTRWSNEDGFEASYLTVQEVDEAGRITYHGRFDEHDFEGAYREFERRYYFGEGAAFADAGATQTEWIVALNRGDLDRLFDELMEPEMRFEMRSSSAFPDSSITEARAAIEDFNATVGSARTWLSALCWVSPTCCVHRTEREAIGHDGERYAWTRLSVVNFRDGRMASECEFDVDDEEATFAYADERIRAVRSRLPLTNRSCDTVAALQNAMQVKDLDGAVRCYAHPSVYDDRRRLSGDPIRSAAGLRLAGERILAQYDNFEWRTLAVRGNTLSMHSSIWSDDAGNASSYLHVYEVDDEGRFIYEGRFDEDDFEGAYRELTRRYCAGEGATVAEGAAHIAEYLTTINRRDWDRVFGELTHPDMHAASRSRSGFPDRSVAGLRASYEDLCAMLAWVRSWHSAEHWVSPTVAVSRHEREARGSDGERYAWTRLIVGEFRDGRATHMCEFDIDDEDAAFGYAEERVRQAENR